MKKLLLALVVVFITGASLFAWEPNDLTKFPIGQDGKNWILNLGVGIPKVVEKSEWEDFVYIPPLRLSLDKNVGIGDKQLPFFIGGILGYTGWGYTIKYWDHKEKHFYNNISIAGRFGYHFNWDVKNLDTYAVTTTGYTFYTHTGDHYEKRGIGAVLWGVNLGARYFVSDWFGFWVETGFIFDAFSADIGIAFKF